MSESPLTLGQFNHINLPTADPVRAVRFYVELLGFRIVPRPPFSFDGRWLYREEVGTMIHLNHLPEHNYRAGPIEPRQPHFAIQCPDVKAVADRLRAEGIEYVERNLPAFGYRQLFFRDPDGNLLELGEWPELREMVKLHEQRATENN